jgi:hypothetical protein
LDSTGKADQRTKLLNAVIEALTEHELKSGSMDSDFEAGIIKINLTFKIKGDDLK